MPAEDGPAAESCIFRPPSPPGPCSPAWLTWIHGICVCGCPCNRSQLCWAEHTSVPTHRACRLSNLAPAFARRAHLSTAAVLLPPRWCGPAFSARPLQAGGASRWWPSRRRGWRACRCASRRGWRAALTPRSRADAPAAAPSIDPRPGQLRPHSRWGLLLSACSSRSACRTLRCIDWQPSQEHALVWLLLDVPAAPAPTSADFTRGAPCAQRASWTPVMATHSLFDNHSRGHGSSQLAAAGAGSAAAASATLNFQNLCVAPDLELRPAL